MGRIETEAPPARVVDAGLLVSVVTLLGTGVATMFVGTPDTAVVYVLHGVAGITLVALVALKLWRVRHRVRQQPTGVVTSLVLAVLTVAALATGVAWVLGISLDLGFWGLLNVHILFGLLVAPVLVAHLRRRFALPRRETLTERRTALQTGGLLVGAALAWRAQQSLNRALETAGADRRFTGSRPEAGEGNDFPVTMWMADDPDPVDTEDWQLQVEGLVADPLTIDADALTGGPEAGEVAFGARQRALLDCTSGWYAERNWAGIDVGALLDAAGVEEGASWVQFRSVTGYRWSLRVEQARDCVLATHVGSERLTHGHGYPLRLVAPDRRGYQWVKWIESVRVSRRRDLAEAVAIFVSGL